MPVASMATCVTPCHQPGHHLLQDTVERRVLAQLVPSFPQPTAGSAHRDRDLLLAHVDRRDALIDDLHGRLPSAFVAYGSGQATRGTRMKIKSLRFALPKAATRGTQPGRAPASIFSTDSPVPRTNDVSGWYPQFHPPVGAPQP